MLRGLAKTAGRLYRFKQRERLKIGDVLPLLEGVGRRAGTAVWRAEDAGGGETGIQGVL